MRNRTIRRGAALCMALCIALACAPASLAAPIGDGVRPACDEAYYATTDYYGNLTDGSVVKSYTLRGAETLTDYGRYDTVTNLSDGTSPDATGGSVNLTIKDRMKLIPFEACIGLTSTLVSVLLFLIVG